MTEASCLRLRKPIKDKLNRLALEQSLKAGFRISSQDIVRDLIEKHLSKQTLAVAE